MTIVPMSVLSLFEPVFMASFFQTGVVIFHTVSKPVSRSNIYLLMSILLADFKAPMPNLISEVERGS